ncbi:MAG: LysM peptidoglycan-binding domain-containing protein [Planctomycetota bacterium]
MISTVLVTAVTFIVAGPRAARRLLRSGLVKTVGTGVAATCVVAVPIVLVLPPGLINVGGTSGAIALVTTAIAVRPVVVAPVNTAAMNNPNGLNNNPNGTTNNPNQTGTNTPQYDQNGFDQNGRDRNGRDRNGFDQNGFDQNGRDRNGRDRNGLDQYGFDQNGRDRNGRDRSGFDQNGFDQNGRDRSGRDRNGLDQNGRDRNGNQPNNTGNNGGSNGGGSGGGNPVTNPEQQRRRAEETPLPQDRREVQPEVAPATTRTNTNGVVIPNGQVVNPECAPVASSSGERQQVVARPLRSEVAPVDTSDMLPLPTHEVARGETLTKIAAKYGVTLQQMKEANPQLAARPVPLAYSSPWNYIRAGEKVFLPSAPRGMGLDEALDQIGREAERQ